jgi:hypothetical protein
MKLYSLSSAGFWAIQVMVRKLINRKLNKMSDRKSRRLELQHSIASE